MCALKERENAGRRSRRWCRPDRAARGRFGGGGRWRSTVTATVTTVSGTTSTQLRPCPAVDRAGGQDGTGDRRRVARLLAAEQPAIELLQLRPDAGERRDRGEQGIEQVWPHAGFRTSQSTRWDNITSRLFDWHKLSLAEECLGGGPGLVQPPPRNCAGLRNHLDVNGAFENAPPIAARAQMKVGPMSRFCLGVLMMLAASAPAPAQDWPSRPITVVVSAAAGGPHRRVRAGDGRADEPAPRPARGDRE